MAEEVSLGSFGEAEPRIGLCFTPVDGASAAAKGTYLANLSKAAALSVAIPALTEALRVPGNAVTLMHDGRTLDLEKTLSENDITIPGARARREGEKIQLGFDTHFAIMKEVEEEAQKKKEAEEAEQKRKVRLELEQQMKEKKMREEAQREQEKSKKMINANELFEEQIMQQVGVNRERFDRLLADPDPDVKKPRHFLERLGREQEQALQSLIDSSGGSARGQVWAYEVHHQDQRDRYERAKQLLQRDAANIPKKSSTTTSNLMGKRELDFLGGFDKSINEFALWHGTSRMEGAGGICANGFDIAYVGSAVGTAWGHGFYFADNSNTALGYSGGGVRVTDLHPRVRVIFLCRVLCGRVNELSAAPTQEQKEELTAKCLGPGGVFGAKSEVHSIYGGRFCYVCAHNHQIYPQVVMFIH